MVASEAGLALALGKNLETQTSELGGGEAGDHDRSSSMERGSGG
jgi:hypothetical protein